MAQALREGKLGVMDEDNLQNGVSVTQMRSRSAMSASLMQPASLSESQ